VRGHVLRGSHPRLISTAPAGLWGKGIREFLTFHIAAQKGKSDPMERRQITIGVWPHHQVPVVRHHTIGEQPHPHPLTRFC